MKLKKLFKSIKLFIKNKYIHIFMMYWGYKATRRSIRTYKNRLRTMNEYMKIIVKANLSLPSERDTLRRVINLYREEASAIEKYIAQKEEACSFCDMFKCGAIDLDCTSLYPSVIREFNIPKDTQID